MCKYEYVLWSYVVDAWGHGSAGPWVGEVKGVINRAEELQQRNVGDRGVVWGLVEGDLGGEV